MARVVFNADTVRAQLILAGILGDFPTEALLLGRWIFATRLFLRATTFIVNLANLSHKKQEARRVAGAQNVAITKLAD